MRSVKRGSKPYFPAEWHPQAFVQITWPTADTDWASTLGEILECYRRLALTISRFEPLIILAHRPQEVEACIGQHPDIHIIPCPYNDTWARDYAFISCLANGRQEVHDFRFNGWGNKFAAELDNQTNVHLLPWLQPVDYVDENDFVLEGGSIETDGRGTLLATTTCLLNPNRNPRLSPTDIEQRLCTSLHCRRVLWLHHGHLIGDDTDAHIDTLARFCSPDTIAYVQCLHPSDEHHDELARMEAELQSFRTPGGQPYRLIPLPLPAPIYDHKGQRLPASYANFLILNGAVLLPTYNQPELDARAQRQLQAAFPSRTVIPLDARALILQHGSIHCATMQNPAP